MYHHSIFICRVGVILVYVMSTWFTVMINDIGENTKDTLTDVKSYLKNTVDVSILSTLLI